MRSRIVEEYSRDRSRIYQIELNFKLENDARVIASRYIPNNSTVLDVGSACGDFGVLLHKHKNCKLYGLEFCSESIDVAKQTNAYLDIYQVDLNTFDSKEFKNFFGHFDCIALLDVLEHVLHPEHVLQELKYFLKSDGFFVVSLPNVAFGDIKFQLLNDDFSYTEVGILDETHLRFYTYRTIADFFTSLGMRIDDCSVKVADISSLPFKVPTAVRRYVAKDPHSFVYQYISKVSSVDLNADELTKTNMLRMDVGWGQINLFLRKIRFQKLVETIFPEGSARRKIAKRIFHALRKSLNQS